MDTTQKPLENTETTFKMANAGENNDTDLIFKYDIILHRARNTTIASYKGAYDTTTTSVLSRLFNKYWQKPVLSTELKFYLDLNYKEILLDPQIPISEYFIDHDNVPETVHVNVYETKRSKIQ